LGFSGFLLVDFVYELVVLVFVIFLGCFEFDIFFKERVDDIIPFVFTLVEGVFEELDLLFHLPVLLINGLQLGWGD